MLLGLTGPFFELAKVGARAPRRVIPKGTQLTHRSATRGARTRESAIDREIDWRRKKPLRVSWLSGPGAPYKSKGALNTTWLAR